MLVLVSSCTKDSELALIHELIQHDHLVLVFAKDVERLRLGDEDEHDRIVPLLLVDTTSGNNDHAQRIISALPVHVHHIINFDGDTFESVVSHFKKTYRKFPIALSTPKNCVEEIQYKMEKEQTNGILFDVGGEQTSKKGWRKPSFLARTGSVRRKFWLPQSSSSRRSSIASSSYTEFNAACVDGDNCSKFRLLAQKLKHLRVQWEKDWKEKFCKERRAKETELKCQIDAHRVECEQRATDEIQAATSDYQNDSISKPIATARIKTAKRQRDNHVIEFERQKEKELTRHMTSYEKEVMEELAPSFVESEIEALEELKCSTS